MKEMIREKFEIRVSGAAERAGEVVIRREWRGDELSGTVGGEGVRWR